MNGLRAVDQSGDPPRLPADSDAARDLVKAVTFALEGIPHRIAYRSALDYLGLLSPPARTVHVATAGSVGFALLGRRPLRTILENETDLAVGADPVDRTFVSDPERAILDAASRPDLIGHATALAVAIAAVAPSLDIDRMVDYASRLPVDAGVRRIGSIAGQLGFSRITKELLPPPELGASVVLDPKGPMKTVWYDERLGVHWNRHRDEFTEARNR